MAATSGKRKGGKDGRLGVLPEFRVDAGTASAGMARDGGSGVGGACCGAYGVDDGLGKGAVRMGGYGTYVAGAALGLVAAFALSAGLAMTGMPQLLLFGVLPAVGGAMAERLAVRRR